MLLILTNKDEEELMSKVYEYFKEKSMYEAVPTMNEVENDILQAKLEESEEKRKRAEVVLRCVAKDSNPTYLKTLVDQYFTEENDKKDK